MKNIKILIAIPVHSHCEPETMQSVYALKVPNGVAAELLFIKGYTVAVARNRLAEHSLRNGFDYTFFVDGDIILPPDALEKLLFVNAGIAAGWYIKKIPGKEIPELYKNNGEGKTVNITVVPENELLPIAGCGFGCALINNSVFRSLGERNWFKYIHEDSGFLCSEDIDFCVRAAGKGVQIVADTSLCCPHIGQYIYIPQNRYSNGGTS